MEEEIGVSVDRITLTGTIETVTRSITSKLTPTASGFLINEHIFAQVLGSGRWRLDFNPNKISDDADLKYILNKMRDTHLSRIDIAFDIFNNPNFMNYRYLNKGKSEIWFNQAKEIETIYYGSFKSRFLIRQYNKKREQETKEISTDYSNWGRIEVQLRNDYTKKWPEYVEKMCQNIVYMDNQELPYNERAILYALKENVISWNELSAPTAKKYRNISLKTHNSKKIQDTLLQTFHENINNLNRVLSSYLK